LSEFAAGYAPIGGYLASTKISASACVPGIAIKLLGAGMSDAKFLRLPALYLVSLNHSKLVNLTPLQDVSPYGMNIIAQLKAEFGEDAIYMKDVESFPQCLEKIAATLSAKRPAIFMFHPNLLIQPIAISKIPSLTPPNFSSAHDVIDFSNRLKMAIHQKKQIYLYVCSEAGIDERINALIKTLQSMVQFHVFCTVNGSNACTDLENYLGHVGLGGRKHVNKTWQSLGRNDVLITLGMEAGDYHFLKNKMDVSETLTITNDFESYGFIEKSYAHRFNGEFHLFKGEIADFLERVIQILQNEILPKDNLTIESNKFDYSHEKKYSESVSVYEFYQQIQHLFPHNSIGFDDVCIAYRDRQFVLNKPSKNIRFFSSQDSSGMGGIFGMLIGAKVSNPNLHCFGFTGDGCWRLFSGAMPEASKLGVVLFLFNNQRYGIVKNYTDKLNGSHYDHSQLGRVDFVKAAKACGWQAYHLAPNLSNLEGLMKKAKKPNNPS